MADTPWRIAEKEGDLLSLSPDIFDDFRQAKRAAMHRNTRRPNHARRWVVVSPSGKVCNTGPEATP